MMRDIEFPDVEGIKLAIARKTDELNREDWHVYLINKNGFDLHNVMIVSKGYSKETVVEDKKKTSTLRQHITCLPAESTTVVERIDEQVLEMCNEFWLSYYANKKLYDKKFVFLPGSVLEDHIREIKELGLDGVVHS